MAKRRSFTKKLPFSWYGGKFSHLGGLLPLLPETHTYVEPFGGSAAVLLNTAPCPVEVYNDLDGMLVNFFRCLRDHRDRLVDALALTPVSREEFNTSLPLVAHIPGEGEDKVELARMFFVLASQGRDGRLDRWGLTRRSRAGMAERVSRVLGKIEGLPAVAERLLRVQIEHDHAIEVIKRYDSKDTLFYCDPPYPPSARVEQSVYQHEMTDEDHKELIECLHRCRGRVALSGYRCELYCGLLIDSRWWCTEVDTKRTPAGKGGRTEFLWTNYDPHELWKDGAQ